MMELSSANKLEVAILHDCNLLLRQPVQFVYQSVDLALVEFLVGGGMVAATR
jgi:hypothetical protein